MFLKAVLYCLAVLPLGILAALDDKSELANRTIDRVCTALYVLFILVEVWCKSR